MTEQKNSKEKDNVSFLYEKLWQESLCEIVPEAEAKEIVTTLLVPDRIDPFAFTANYSKFVESGMPSLREMFLGEAEGTPSIKIVSNPLRYIPRFPDWFYAAYPDVFLWLSDMQRKLVDNLGANEDYNDARSNLLCELFVINSENENVRADDFIDSQDKWLPKLLKNLVSSYKRETGKKPETSVEETKNNAIKEIYENIQN